MILKKNKRQEDILFLLSLILVIVFPLFPDYFGNNSFHIIPLTIFLSLLLLLKRRNKFKLDKGIVRPTIFFFMTFVILLLSLINESFFIAEVQVKDFIGTIKPFYSYLFFLVGYVSIMDDEKKINSLCRFFEILIVFSFLLAIVETFFLDQFRGLIYFLYKRKERLILIDKATGWFGVTYYFSYFMSLLCFYSFFMLTKRKSIFYFLLFCFSLITIFLTQSRTLILALIAGFLILPFLKQSFKNKSVYIFYALALLLVVYLGLRYSDLLQERLGYAYIGITRLFEQGVELQGGDSGSVNVRINQFWWAWEENKYKLIGYGLGRSTEVALESIYAYYMYRFGIIYLIAYILLFFYFFKMASKMAVKYKDHVTYYSFFSACSIFYLISPIALIASPSHEMPKIAFMFYICSAIVYKFYIKTKKYG
ncbi:hypothetical protein BTO06_02950 [Tenacibaculum sp. SZ-18]|uniref:oligosaccharide repeat unit polymerase n=1 Tax=Tenacibaculum sp. SZ-18 TaxID=754423 RepID=UPI000C2D36EF|nr:oligosaccharide repeat unit polymerase [Tenacibaculum sp. SZ-18]AUC14169.1 hypothetical protein BTO06_02950 [Tenacibaculum sp. SZ-18]